MNVKKTIKKETSTPYETIKLHGKKPISFNSIMVEHAMAVNDYLWKNNVSYAKISRVICVYLGADL